MRVAFLGSQEIGARCLEVILDQGHEVVCVATFSAGVHENWPDDVRRLAEKRGLPLIRARRFRTKRAVAELRALAPDILFAIGWRWILPDPVLAIPAQGCLGIHGSLLPRLRGFAPVNWALLRDEPQTGPSLFYFDAGTDTGDLVGQAPFAITDEDDAATIRRRIADESVALLARHLPGLADGTAPRISQPLTGATYGPQRRPQDGWVDWEFTSRQLFNWVRGLTRPYPGAMATLGGKLIRIWKVRQAIGMGPGPGVVEDADANPLFVGSGAGRVELLDAAFDGDDSRDSFATLRHALRQRGRFDSPHSWDGG